MYPHFDGSLRRASLIANAVVLAAVLFPLFGQTGFSLLSPVGSGYLALLVLFTLWLFIGPGMMDRFGARRGLLATLHFAILVVLFASVFWMPVRNSNAWLLAMPIVAASVILLRWPGVLAVGVALLAAIEWRHAQGFGSDWRREVVTSASQLSVAMGFTAGCTLLAMRERAMRARAEELARKIEEANAELRAANARVAELAAARERNRIARDIHDGLGHYLTAVAVQLQAARALLPGQPDRAIEALGKAEQGTQQALADVRRSVGTLREERPVGDLSSRLAELVGGCGLDVTYRREGPTRPLSPPVQEALFRAAQEGLTNVRKHAGTMTATLCLNFRDDSRVALSVSDSGSGAGGASGHNGFGLRGLDERLAAVGGTLVAGNRPQGGFSIEAEVPA